MIDRIKDIWGPRTPYGRDGEWPVRVDEHLVDGQESERAGGAGDGLTWTQSACVLCSNGCGLDIAVRDGRMVGVRGRADDRVSHGRLGPKGLYGWQANLAADRLIDPMVREGGELRPASWDEAMGRVVERTQQILAEHGPLGLGFYTSGQLFLEDYYTLAVIARGGLGTPHLDGNTRLCTATSDAALKETFGCDGDPGSVTDFDCCDTLFAVGHNMAETHTVLWARVLDRLCGPDRPRLVVVDPRPTPVAREADVHLAILPGTNVALLNAIQHELIANGWVDQAFVEAHTIGFDALAKVVRGYPPERAAEICGVDPASIGAAARLIGTSQRLVSTCLQGVYQSHQATAAACQVNNITLLRGMIGRPGCAVFQMNGQPTAQNTRETGADGDMTGMRNWHNPVHVADLARIWNVDPLQIPSWSPPTHAMQIFRYAEEGAIRFLWVTGTNPAVSMPELDRIRSILEDERLFLVVSDAFLSETAVLADVVLPAAIWGEKLGTFTNHDRTVHLSEQAVPPPGRARPDMAIFLDYARRLGLTDLDGRPLPPWTRPEECFDAFKEATRGRPCDYSGLSYDLLRGSGGIQWPCNEEHPAGTERLYVDHQFPSATDVCEDYGHDLLTGADLERHEHAALRADGRAVLRAADQTPPLEPTSEDFPLVLTTGRTVYQFHTRTKTARTPELEAAAPEPWVELHPSDAERMGIGEGDLVQVESPRGRVIARARVSGVRSGVVFTPFHYGYWDQRDDGRDARSDAPDERAANGGRARPGRRPTAANELTLTAWDPVSKQPTFKVAAVRVAKLADSDGRPSAAPVTTASAPATTGPEVAR